MFEKYIDDVKNERIIVNEYIKLAIKRFEDFRNRSDIYFNINKVNHVINFIQTIKHYVGEYAGKPFELQPWQCFIIASIFGFYRVDNNKRLVNNVFLFLARKNGKSALAAAIALYLLVADDENSPELVFAANSREQSKILLEITTNFAKSIDKNEKFIKIYRNEIKTDFNKGKAKIVSADAGKLDGLNLSSFIIDEYHEAKDTKMYDVLASSQGMRKNPLSIIISTAGFSTQSPCKSLFDTSIQILRGVKTDDSFFCALYTTDENDDYTNNKNWIKANPNLNVTISEDFIKNQILKAKNDNSAEFGVKTKTLNIWCSNSDTWLSHDRIIKSIQNVDIETFKDKIAYVGVDLSVVSDLTAVSFLIPNNNIFYFKNYYYLPQSTIDEHKNKEFYKKMYYEKQITLTPGNVVDYDYILKDIMNKSTTLQIQGVYYDTYNSTQFAINATEAGLNMIPFSQSLANFNAPTKEFDRLLRSNKIVIDNNYLNIFCMQNAVLKFDHNQNCKPVKVDEKNSKKIDGVIAMIEALGGYLITPKFDNEIYTFTF